MTQVLADEVVQEAMHFEAALLAGRFDPEAVPTLDHPMFQVDGRLEAGCAPDCSYELLADALRQAELSLLIYIYNISSRELVDIILERMDAGVSVRLMYDASDGGAVEKERLDALRQRGAGVVRAPSSGPNSVFTVCHQKLVVVDDTLVCLGSANWAGTGFPSNPGPSDFRRSNREWVVAVTSPGLAAWYAALFEADWALATRPVPQDAAVFPEPAPAGVFVTPLDADAPAPPGPFPRWVRGDGAPITVQPVTSPGAYADIIGALIDGAAGTICVQQQYILISGPHVDRLLAKLSRVHHERGVSVRVIVSPAFRKVGKVDNWELTVQALARHNLGHTLRAMNLRMFKHLHNKGLIVDDAVVVSSTNWSDNSIARAREAGVVVHDAELAAYFRRIFDADWAVAWPAVEVKPNMAELIESAAFRADGFQVVDPADIV